MTCRLQQLSEERGDSRRKLLLLTSSRCFPAGVAAERLEGKVERADANSLSSHPTQRVRNKRAVTSNSDDNGKKKKKSSIPQCSGDAGSGKVGSWHVA